VLKVQLNSNETILQTLLLFVNSCC